MPKGIGYGKKASKITGMPIKELAKMKKAKKSMSGKSLKEMNEHMKG